MQRQIQRCSRKKARVSLLLPNRAPGKRLNRIYGYDRELREIISERRPVTPTAILAAFRYNVESCLKSLTAFTATLRVFHSSYLPCATGGSPRIAQERPLRVHFLPVKAIVAERRLRSGKQTSTEPLFWMPSNERQLSPKAVTRSLGNHRI